MKGVLLVIKPPAMTSFDVVAWLRGIIGVRKIGHAGTLDPAAGGLLPICIGKATKSMEWFSNFHKAYRVEMILGITTDTYDGEGNILDERPVKVDANAIEEVFSEFIGEFEQVPPMFSAVKVKGKRLYELARKGVEVDRKARKITVASLKLLGITHRNGHPIVRFNVKCSKGTYVRSLCHDMGQKLGCGAYMSFLVRTEVGPFTLKQAVTLEEIENSCRKGRLSSVLRPVDSVFKNYLPIFLEKENETRFVNGVPVSCDMGSSVTKGDTIRVYAGSGSFIGLGVVVIHHDKMMVKPKKIFTVM